ncbi:MAG: hypothetical protein ACRDQ5_18765, partial [Sciscionella sp.]
MAQRVACGHQYVVGIRLDAALTMVRDFFTEHEFPKTAAPSTIHWANPAGAMRESSSVRLLPSREPTGRDTQSAIRYLLWLAREQWISIVLGSLFSLLWMVSQAVFPAAVGRTIDAGIIARDSGQLLFWSLIILALGTVRACAGILFFRNALVLNVVSGYFTVDVVTKHVTRLGAALPKLAKTSDVIAIGTADLNGLGRSLDIVPRLLGAVVAIGTIAMIMLLTSVPLG